MLVFEIPYSYHQVAFSMTVEQWGLDSQVKQGSIDLFKLFLNSTESVILFSLYNTKLIGKKIEHKNLELSLILKNTNFDGH